jgi:hypothetical protein
MSFGFIRKQSPASIADARRRAAGRRFKLLTNLRIDEVSSVSRGAGKGVRVALLKRDTSGDPKREWDHHGPPLGYRGYRFTKGESDMPNTLSERVAKSHQAALRGDITFAEAASDQMDRALEMFPHAQSPGEAMQKYMQTEVGQRDVNNLHRAQFIKTQWSTRVGDGVQPGAVLKKLGEGDGRGGPPARVHMDASRDGAVVDGNGNGGDGGADIDNGVEEPWGKRVQRLMDKHGISHDAAVTMLHRAEKVAKGI